MHKLYIYYLYIYISIHNISSLHNIYIHIYRYYTHSELYTHIVSLYFLIISPWRNHIFWTPPSPELHQQMLQAHSEAIVGRLAAMNVSVLEGSSENIPIFDRGISGG